VGMSGVQTAEQLEAALQSIRSTVEQHLAFIRKEPSAYSMLSIRSLLDFREMVVRENGFEDAYHFVKRRDTELALSLYEGVLSRLEAMTDWEERQRALIEGVLGGNCFDWGSTEVVRMMEAGELSFDVALEKVVKPFQIDDMDAWLARLRELRDSRAGDSGGYRKVVVFVDNSGADVCLGILPFARELCKMGSVVILASNSVPALNDVTHPELLGILDAVGKMDPLLQCFVEEGKLRCVESGSSSACIDLRRVNAELAQLCSDAELVVLVGMGRSVHTNFRAEFTCDSLKLACIKNAWVAQQLIGGTMFSAIVRFERSPTS